MGEYLDFKTYTENIEGGQDDEGEEQSVVVEYGECCGLILSNLQTI